MTHVTREIEFYITISEFDGFSTTIDRMHQLSPTPHGIEREATGIAEHIEYTFTTSKSLEQWTVLSLVYEEPRLLSTQPVDIELQPILKGNIIVTTPIEETVLHMIHKG